MKTTPNVPQEESPRKVPPAVPQRTEAPGKAELHTFEGVHFSQSGPVENLDCALDFSFEKSRVKAMERTELFASVSTSSVMPELTAVRQAEQTFAHEAQQFELLSYCLRTFAIITTLLCTLNMVATFFAVLLLALSNVPAENYMLWVGLEASSAVVFMFVSIKITGLNKVTVPNSQPYFKLCLIYCIVLIGLILGVDQKRSFGGAVQCAEYAGDSEATREQRQEGKLCMLLVFFYVACVYKLGIILAYLAMWVTVLAKFARMSRREGRPEVESGEAPGTGKVATCGNVRVDNMMQFERKPEEPAAIVKCNDGHNGS